MVCENLPEGEYTLEKATEKDMKDMLKYTKDLIESGSKLDNKAKVDTKTDKKEEESKETEIKSKLI